MNQESTTTDGKPLSYGEYLRLLMARYEEFLHKYPLLGAMYLCPFIDEQYSKLLNHDGFNSKSVKSHTRKLSNRIEKSLNVVNAYIQDEIYWSTIDPLLNTPTWGRLHYLRALAAEALVWERN